MRILMTRPYAARAPKGATGACRSRRRRKAARRPEWVRPYRRAQRALDAAVRLIFEAFDAIEAAGRCAERCPVRTARRLTGAIRQMVAASRRLFAAQRELAEARELLGRVPERQAGDAPELVELAAERCRAVARYILITTSEVLVAQTDVMGGLATGELVPEHPSNSRPRITITPRPVPVRAFLAARRPRVADRITAILLRRLRTPRPAEVRAPRRSVRGRAPPVRSTCSR
jgi:hypothetical protein